MHLLHIQQALSPLAGHANITLAADQDAVEQTQSGMLPSVCFRFFFGPPLCHCLSSARDVITSALTGETWRHVGRHAQTIMPAATASVTTATLALTPHAKAIYRVARCAV